MLMILYYKCVVGVTELEGTLGTIVDTIVKVFTSVDWNKVFVIGTILAFVYSVTKMTTAITNLSKTLTKAVHPFSSIVESITGFIGGMKTAIGNNLNAKSLRVYATGHNAINHRYFDPFCNEITVIIY